MKRKRWNRMILAMAMTLVMVTGLLSPGVALAENVESAWAAESSSADIAADEDALQSPSVSVAADEDVPLSPSIDVVADEDTSQSPPVDPAATDEKDEKKVLSPLAASAPTPATQITVPYSENNTTLSSGMKVSWTENDGESFTVVGKAYQVTLTAGTAYDIQMSEANDSDIDTYIIVNSQGQEVTHDDNSGNGYNSRLRRFIPSTTGVYYIIATSYGGEETGSFNFSIVDYVLPAGGIQGQVTPGSSDTHVALYRYQRDEDLDWGFQHIDDMSTDGDGNYQFLGLDPGNYKAKFYSQNGNYVTQYYNNKRSLSTADTITVGSSVVSNINGTLQPAGKITGVVKTESGAALEDIRVFAFDSDSAFSFDPNSVSSTYTNASGAYTIGGLTTGNYIIEFYDRHNVYLTQYYNGKTTLSSGDSISVVAGQTTTVGQTTMQIGGKITGVVKNESGVALWDIEVTVFDSDGNYVSSTYTNYNYLFGTYMIDRLAPGNYRIEFRDVDYGDGYVPQYYNGKTTLDSADSISVVEGQTTSANPVIMKRGGTLTGRVTDSSGFGIGDIEVIVYTLNAATNKWEENSYYSGWTDYGSRAGYYTIKGINPGTAFKVRFHSGWENYIDQYYSNKATLSEATPLTVTAGGTVTANAQLRTGGQIKGTVTIPNYAGKKSDYYSNIPRVTVFSKVAGTTNAWEERDFIYGNTDGTYTVMGLDTGDYKLKFQDGAYECTPQFYSGANTVEAATAIHVNAGATVSPINAVLTYNPLATIVFDSNGGAEVSPLMVNRGSPIGTLPTPTRSGYTFDGWYFNWYSGSKISSDYIVTTSLRLFARWTKTTGGSGGSGSDGSGSGGSGGSGSDGSGSDGSGSGGSGSGGSDPDVNPPPIAKDPAPSVAANQKNAKLKSVTTSAGKLSPKFNASKLSYKLTIPAKKNGAKLSFKKSFAGATILIKIGKGKYKKVSSVNVKLKKGKSVTVYVKVTAADKKTTKVYKFKVTRKKK